MSNELDWESTQPQDQQVDQVVDEALGFDEYQDNPQDSEILAEAIERIEQAKLYESLIKHDFFGPGSARQEIQDRVTREIRGFILERLEILLGIKAPASKIIQTQAISQFDNDEVDALKEIASRLIQKSRQSSPSQPVEPKVKQFIQASTDPAPQQVRPTSPKINQTKPTQPTQPTQRPPQRGQPLKNQKPVAPPLASTPEERLANGTYKPQAVSKTHPPKPMPSQQQINQIHAQEVERRQASGAVGINDQILRLAVSASQNINKNVVETLNDDI